MGDEMTIDVAANRLPKQAKRRGRLSTMAKIWIGVVTVCGYYKGMGEVDGVVKRNERQQAAIYVFRAIPNHSAH
jgi:hypothetical protein